MRSRTLQRKQPSRFAPKCKYTLRAAAIEAAFPKRLNVSSFEKVLRKIYPMLQLKERTLHAFCSRHNIGFREGNSRILSREDMVRLNRTAARTADLFHGGDFLNPRELGEKLNPPRTKTAVHITLKNVSAHVNPKTGSIYWFNTKTRETFLVDPKTGSTRRVNSLPKNTRLMPYRIPFITVEPGTTIGEDYSRYLIPKHVVGEFDSIESRWVEQRRKDSEQKKTERERKKAAEQAEIDTRAADRARIAGERKQAREQEAAEKRKKLLTLAAERTSSQSEADKRAKKRAEQKKTVQKKPPQKKATIKKAIPKGTAPKATAIKPATPKPPAIKPSTAQSPIMPQKEMPFANNPQTIAPQKTARAIEPPAETKPEPVPAIHANPLAEAVKVYDAVCALRDNPGQQTETAIKTLRARINVLRAEGSPARSSFDAIAADATLKAIEQIMKIQTEESMRTPEGSRRESRKEQ